MITTFVMGTAIAVLWLGQLLKVPRPLTGVLSAGIAVCGVSAAVAAAPVVKARGIDMAYSIGMLLLVEFGRPIYLPSYSKNSGLQ